MKNILILIIICLINGYSDWSTFGGNSQRTSFLNTIGPESKDDILWEGTINAGGGHHILVSNNKLVTMRGDDYWLHIMPMVCHDIYTGEVLWTQEFEGDGRSPTNPIGFKDNVIYASNWQGGSGEDTLYALNAANGDIIWKNGIGIHGSPYLGCTFLENNDFLVTLKYGGIACFNHITGDTIWTIENLVPIIPAYCQISVFKNTAYIWEFSDALSIVALDVRNGNKKYRMSLPNTFPPSNLMKGTFPVINGDGIIFLHRANNVFVAIKDDNEKLSVLWCDTIRGAGETSPAIGPDGSVYYVKNYKIMRADPDDGTILDSSMIMFPDSITEPVINFAIDANGTIFCNVTFSQNKLFSFTKDLKLNWTDTIPVISHGGPALSSSGLLAVAGKGDLLRVYKPKDLNVADTKLTSTDFIISNKLNSLSFLFNLDKALNVNLSIYNIRGQQIYHSNNSVNTSGFYEIEVKDLSSGQYISRVELGSETIVRKVNVVQ